MTTRNRAKNNVNDSGGVTENEDQSKEENADDELEIAGFTGGTPKRRTRVDDWQRARQAYELRLAGMPFYEIADTVGYSTSDSCKTAIENYIRTIGREEKNTLVKLSLERLNWMLMGLWPAIHEGNAHAAQVGLQIITKIHQLEGVEDMNSVQVTIDHQNVPETKVLVIGGSKDEYIAALQQHYGLETGKDQSTLEAIDTVAVEKAAHAVLKNRD